MTNHILEERQYAPDPKGEHRREDESVDMVFNANYFPPPKRDLKREDESVDMVFNVNYFPPPKE
ncbi:hypothetical protein QCA50_000886 [Cerrena zonata]|uniref:Uncharacterized protein n=1 Tax=Cerrena zonata TaxID=2478898 RepID=A0AAW0GS38_9APHY